MVSSSIYVNCIFHIIFRNSIIRYVDTPMLYRYFFQQNVPDAVDMDTRIFWRDEFEIKGLFLQYEGRKAF